MSDVTESKPVIIDGITCYCADVDADCDDYHAAGLDSLYRAESRHFWFVARREWIISLFDKYIDKASRVIEIGAGTGSVARALITAGYHLCVGELHLNGLRYARSYGIEECYQFDLYSQPFTEEFDAVGMFDVLEHLDDTERALVQISRMLRPAGSLVITVPAHKWLWSREDTIAGHKCRYTKKLLIEQVESAGFRVMECRYFFVLLLPLLLLRKWLHPDSGARVEDSERKIEMQVPSFVNYILVTMLRLERRLSPVLPNFAGGSLYMVAEKI